MSLKRSASEAGMRVSGTPTPESKSRKTGSGRNKGEQTRDSHTTQTRERFQRNIQAARIKALDSDCFSAERRTQTDIADLGEELELTPKSRRKTKKSSSLISSSPSSSSLASLKMKKYKLVGAKGYIYSSFARVLEEERNDLKATFVPTCENAVVGASKYPPRPFCLMCGLLADYTCPQCGAKYCSLSCNEGHKETRCLKYV